jgi:hypothetical protein
MAGWPLGEQRDVHVWAYGSPHACAEMPWGGGVTYFKLGVGWCSYDASTEGHFLIFDPALWSVAPHTFSLVQPCVNNYTVVYTHKQYSIQYSYSLRWGGGGLWGSGPPSPYPGQFFDDDILLCLLWVLSFYGAERGGDMGQGGGGWRMEIGEQGLEEGRPGKMQQDTPINR